jgi:hypothetical protein
LGLTLARSRIGTNTKSESRLRPCAWLLGLDDAHYRHAWTKGEYIQDRRGEHWVPHRWEERNGRYHLDEVHWERGSNPDERRFRRSPGLPGLYHENDDRTHRAQCRVESEPKPPFRGQHQVSPGLESKLRSRELILQTRPVALQENRMAADSG